MTSMSSFERFLYKAYILFLPFGRFVELPFGDFVNKIVTSMSTYIMLIGIACLVIRHRGLPRLSRMIPFRRLYAFMALYSICASVVLYFFLDSSVPETPLRACLGDIVLYLLALLSIYYNCYHLTHSVSFSSLYRLFEVQIVILLSIGYIQFGALVGNSQSASLYESLSSFLTLAESKWLMDMDRGVCFFGSEPASASLLCLVVIPFILAQIYYNKGWKRMRYIVYICLFSLLFFSSNSSSLLISYLTILLCVVVVCNFPKFRSAVLKCAFLLGLIIAVLYGSDFKINAAGSLEDTRDVAYVVYGKLVDRDNLSTAMRASSIINDMRIFRDYPLTGVGNGNQGYFYNQNMPLWVQASEEVQGNMSGRNGVPNGGGNFFPAYISAFGLIGIFVLFFFFYRKMKFYYSTSFLQEDAVANTIFILGLTLFLLSSWFVMGVTMNECVLFLLVLPLISSSLKPTNA